MNLSTTRALLWSILILSFSLDAQTNRLSFNWEAGPTVQIDGQNLAHPFMGGMDLIQWSRVDLNRDGVEDLAGFDRQGTRWLTFLAQNKHWISAPEYADSLPNINHWGLFRDFNCDGKKDLFSYTLGGIGVWKNTSTADSLSFTWALPGNYLMTNYGSSTTNLYNYNTDIPAILDFDNDGDIDIFTFGQRASIEWHEGTSNCGLDFTVNTSCWGRFEESGATNDLILNACTGVLKVDGAQKNNGSMHIGSTLLMLDLNNDTLQDVLIGDVSFSNLVAAYNTGDMDSAVVSAKDTSYPSAAPVTIPYFPAAFYEDMDFDGVKDLIVAPNLEGSINTKNNWLYKNTGSTAVPVWSAPDSAFLVDQMIDLGSAAKPALVDLDFDGDLDLIVGSDGTFVTSGNYQNSLYYFKNTGTIASPSFELMDTDFADCGANSLGQALSPAFGDLDGDMDQDMLVGLADGRIIYYENTGNFLNHSYAYRGQLQNIDVGNYATPALGDITGDGNPDLLIGNEFGNISMYHWSGAYPTIFTFVSDQWAGIDTRTPSAPSGYSVPAIVYGTDTTLLVGTMDNGVIQFDSLNVILNGAAAVDMQLATGTTASTTIEETPFGGSKRTGRTQLIIPVDELKNAGGSFGLIGQIGFEIGTNSSLYLTQGFTISMKHISDTALSTFQNQGFTQVFDGIRVMTTGWNDINLTTPFMWNGEDHLLVEICFSKHAQTGDIPVILSNTSYHSTLYGDAASWNAITNDGCAMPYAGKLKVRPNIRFNVVPSLREMDNHFISAGDRLHPAVGDINADGFPDLILGNKSGGLHYFIGKAFDDLSMEELAMEEPCVLYPNPATHFVQYKCPSTDVRGATIFNAMGQEILRFENECNLQLRAGIYIVRFEHLDGHHSTQRLVVQ